MMDPVTYMPLTIILGGLIIAFIGLAVYVYAFLGVNVKSNKQMLIDELRWLRDRFSEEREWVLKEITRINKLREENTDMIWNESGRLDKLIDYLGLEEKVCDKAEIVKKGK